MKVYIVYTMYYGEKIACGVALSREVAENFANKIRANWVEEVELGDEDFFEFPDVNF